MPTLDEIKLYLRIDHKDEDNLLNEFAKASTEICESVLRQSISGLEPVPEAVKQALLYTISNFYESRESLDIKKLMETLKYLLSPYRKESW